MVAPAACTLQRPRRRAFHFWFQAAARGSRCRSSRSTAAASAPWAGRFRDSSTALPVCLAAAEGGGGAQVKGPGGAVLRAIFSRGSKNWVSCPGSDTRAPGIWCLAQRAAAPQARPVSTPPPARTAGTAAPLPTPPCAQPTHRAWRPELAPPSWPTSPTERWQPDPMTAGVCGLEFAWVPHAWGVPMLPNRVGASWMGCCSPTPAIHLAPGDCCRQGGQLGGAAGDPHIYLLGQRQDLEVHGDVILQHREAGLLQTRSACQRVHAGGHGVISGVRARLQKCARRRGKCMKALQGGPRWGSIHHVPMNHPARRFRRCDRSRRQ